MQTYLVGGAVRDQLLGYPYTEQDWVVVGATPEQMKEAGYTPVGKDFPVFLHPETKEEHALARTERKTAPGYGGFRFNASPEVTLEDDLVRRDLTINAIARTESGELVDPYGGERDIRERILRHVSPAFSEDPVRILRVARFAARYHHLGFRVADETLDLMQSMVTSGEADHLVPERVWKEWEKALGERDPAVFIDTLRQCNALATIIPELNRLFGIPQPAEHHPEVDTGQHALLALTQAARLSDCIRVRFATLVHDLGKGETPEAEWPRHIGHEKLGLEPIRQLCQRLAVPNDHRDLALLACEYHTHVHRALELKPGTMLKVLQKTDAFRRPERFAELLVVCEADACGRTGFERRDYPQRDYMLEALNRARDVDVKALLEQGYKGAEMGQAIEQKRLEALTGFKRHSLQRHQGDSPS